MEAEWRRPSRHREGLCASYPPTYAWALASERPKALAAAGLLETVYAPVRERIEAREGMGEK